MDDFRKLERARRGDRKAWSYLYVKYYDRVLAEAESVAEREASDADPEDLLQRYWIESVETEPVSIRAAEAGSDPGFDDWLEADFRRWWQENRSSGDEVVDGMGRRPGTGCAERAF